MSRLLNDVRYAIRSLAKTPGTSLLMVATLAIGLAANGIIFNFLDALMLRAFDFPNTARLVRVAETDPNLGGIDRETVAPANLLDWEAQGRGGLAGMIAIDLGEVNLRADAGAE